jgi:hypothetical protein
MLRISISDNNYAKIDFPNYINHEACRRQRLFLPVRIFCQLFIWEKEKEIVSLFTNDDSNFIIKEIVAFSVEN